MQTLVTHIYGVALKRRTGMTDDEIVMSCCEQLAKIFSLQVHVHARMLVIISRCLLLLGVKKQIFLLL